MPAGVPAGILNTVVAPAGNLPEQMTASVELSVTLYSQSANTERFSVMVIPSIEAVTSGVIERGLVPGVEGLGRPLTNGMSLPAEIDNAPHRSIVINNNFALIKQVCNYV